MSTYETIKKVLENGNKKAVVTIEKLDVFLLGDRISEEEYKELVSMLEESEA